MALNLDKTLEDWAKMRLAHEAVMLSDAKQLLAQERESAKAHAERTNGKPMTPADDMIHIGDKIDNHPAPKGLSKFAAAGIAAAALLSGGAGALGLAALLKDAPIAAPVKSLAPQEFDVEWKIIDGKAGHTVRPVK